MIRSKYKKCPVCGYTFFNADEAIMPYIGSPVFKKRCPNCGALFEYCHNEEFDNYYYMNLEPSMLDPFKITGKLPEIKRIIKNNPVTVILWEDGTKTMAKCQDGDIYDFEKGVLICSLKKLIGNKATNGLLKQVEEEQYTGTCTTCKFVDTSFDIDPCRSCIQEQCDLLIYPNWEPKE